MGTNSGTTCVSPISPRARYGSSRSEYCWESPLSPNIPFSSWTDCQPRIRETPTASSIHRESGRRNQEARADTLPELSPYWLKKVDRGELNSDPYSYSWRSQSSLFNLNAISFPWGSQTSTRLRSATGEIHTRPSLNQRQLCPPPGTSGVDPEYEQPLWER